MSFDKQNISISSFFWIRSFSLWYNSNAACLTKIKYGWNQCQPPFYCWHAHFEYYTRFFFTISFIQIAITRSLKSTLYAILLVWYLFQLSNHFHWKLLYWFRRPFWIGFVGVTAGRVRQSIVLLVLARRQNAEIIQVFRDFRRACAVDFHFEYILSNISRIIVDDKLIFVFAG